MVIKLAQHLPSEEALLMEPVRQEPVAENTKEKVPNPKCHVIENGIGVQNSQNEVKQRPQWLRDGGGGCAKVPWRRKGTVGARVMDVLTLEL